MAMTRASCVRDVPNLQRAPAFAAGARCLAAGAGRCTIAGMTPFRASGRDGPPDG